MNIRRCAAIAALGFTAACGGGGKDKDGPASASSVASSTPPAPSTAVPEQNAGPAPEFVYAFKAPDDEKLKKYAALFELDQLKSVVNLMNRQYRLKRRVPVIAGGCGEVNAFYDKSVPKVQICFELADYLYNAFLQAGRSDQEASQDTLNSLTFTMLHEMGHALIAELDIGVPGKEEDVVDDFATLLLVDVGQAKMAADGARSMRELAKMNNKPKYYDEHPLGEQRFYDILCVIVGSNPEKFRDIVVKGVLPQERGERCPDEYARKNKFWTTALKEFSKKG